MKTVLIIMMTMFFGLSTAQALKVIKVDVSEVEQKLALKSDSKGTETLGIFDTLKGGLGELNAAFGFVKVVGQGLASMTDAVADIGFEACKAAGCYKDKATEMSERKRVTQGAAMFKAGLKLDFDTIGNKINKSLEKDRRVEEFRNSPGAVTQTLFDTPRHAGKVMTTMITYTFDDGRTLVVPFEHTVHGKLTANQKAKLKEAQKDHPLNQLAEAVDPQSSFGGAVMMGQIAIKAMNDAVMSVKDQGQEAMVQAANNIIIGKNNKGNETLFDFGAAVIDGVKGALGLKNPFIINPSIFNEGRIKQGVTQDIKAGKYDAQVKFVGDTVEKK